MSFKFESPEQLLETKPQPLEMTQMFRNLERLEEQKPQAELPEDVQNYLSSLEQPVEPVELGELPLSLIEAHDIYEASQEWHKQSENNTCVVSCEGFIINEYLDKDVTEQELAEYARSQDWLREGGTPCDKVGNLLELHGIEVHRDFDGTYQELREALLHNDRVIVGVNNMALNEEWADFYPFLTANHGIEVLAIDQSDPENVRVVVNDPGVDDGCTKEIDLDTFLKAWSTSDGFMMVAKRPKEG